MTEQIVTAPPASLSWPDWKPDHIDEMKWQHVGDARVRPEHRLGQIILRDMIDDFFAYCMHDVLISADIWHTRRVVYRASHPTNGRSFTVVQVGRKWQTRLFGADTYYLKPRVSKRRRTAIEKGETWLNH